MSIKHSLKAALAISNLLELYCDFAESNGFDREILDAGFLALRHEIEGALAVVEKKIGTTGKTRTKREMM